MKKLHIIILLCFLILTSVIVINLKLIDDTDVKTPTIENTEVKEKEIKETKYFDGWTTESLNVRKEPNTNSEIIGILLFNEKITYKKYNSKWFKITYNNNVGYVCKDYISDKEIDYDIYSVPDNTGFKSYMGYEAITDVTSKQNKLQNMYAYTGNYGIRMVNDRYCIALGTYFTQEIGQYVDLILENGTVIPCVLADIKADEHTDSNNITTLHNGCVTEFVIDSANLIDKVKITGDISNCKKEWSSPVIEIKVYNKNAFC